MRAARETARPDVAIAGQLRVAGVDAHAHLGLALRRARRARPSPAAPAAAALTCVAGAGEGHEEGLRLAVDHHSLVGGERFLRAGGGARRPPLVALAEAALQLRRALDVREEEGDRAAGQLGHGRLSAPRRGRPQRPLYTAPAVVDPRVEKLAGLLVERCIDVQPGWQVLVMGHPGARPLLEEVCRQIGAARRLRPASAPNRQPAAARLDARGRRGADRRVPGDRRARLRRDGLVRRRRGAREHAQRLGRPGRAHGSCAARRRARTWSGSSRARCPGSASTSRPRRSRRTRA